MLIEELLAHLMAGTTCVACHAPLPIGTRHYCFDCGGEVCGKCAVDVIGKDGMTLCPACAGARTCVVSSVVTERQQRLGGASRPSSCEEAGIAQPRLPLSRSRARGERK